jgi:hypothetical protein
MGASICDARLDVIGAENGCPGAVALVFEHADELATLWIHTRVIIIISDTVHTTWILNTLQR